MSVRVKSHSPELTGLEENVSEITVTGADGCKHSGRWRATEAYAEKGYSKGGKSWPLLANLISFVQLSLHYSACNTFTVIAFFFFTSFPFHIVAII